MLSDPQALGIYSIYDSKADSYLQPFFSPTDATAIRAVSDVVRDSSHQFAKFAEDYTLFLVGLWDETSGALTAVAPKHLVGLWTLKAALKNGVE